MLESLGRAIALWHRLDRRALPPFLRRRGRGDDDLSHFLSRDVDAAVDLPESRASAWRHGLARVASMRPVLIHGDINEGQILVDDSLRVTGIVDWETANIGHPLKDFDFGEWSYGIFAWDRQFDLLHRRFWEGCVSVHGGDLPSWRAVHLCFCLKWAFWFSQRPVLTPWQRARLANTLVLLRHLEAERDSDL